MVTPQGTLSTSCCYREVSSLNSWLLYGGGLIVSWAVGCRNGLWFLLVIGVNYALSGMDWCVWICAPLGNGPWSSSAQIWAKVCFIPCLLAFWDGQTEDQTVVGRFERWAVCLLGSTAFVACERIACFNCVLDRR